mmetsp:Transcript_103063/g.204607  ORF Transcript_103063/g.204607 Transcript_103063/m.204607 type:complete len:499 (-) Transcript_103063:102-1598(-)
MGASLPLVALGAIMMTTTVLPTLALRDDGVDSRVYTNDSNDEGVHISTYSGVEPLTVYACLDLAFQSIDAIQRTQAEVTEHLNRKNAIEAIAQGHTRNVAQLVKNAHAGAVQAMEGGSLVDVADFLKSDAFLLFKELLDIFETAHTMCVKEDTFMEDPFKWMIGHLARLGEEKKDQNEILIKKLRLERAQQAISEITKALRSVVDEKLCPMLENSIRTHLWDAHSSMEEWEQLAQNYSGKPVSWFEMFNKVQESGYGWASEFAGGMDTKVNEAVHKLWRNTDYMKQEQCLRTISGEMPPKRNLDDYEVSWHEDDVTEQEMRIKTYRLKALATNVNEALDSASINLEMFEKECGRYEPKKRAGLMKRMQVVAAFGNKEEAGMHRVMSCDYCMREGCRAIGVLGVIQTTWAVVRNTVGYVLKKALKALAPKWFNQIMQGINGAVFVVKAITRSSAVAVYSTMVFFASKKAALDQKDQCEKLGQHLEESAMALTNYPGYGF